MVQRTDLVDFSIRAAADLLQDLKVPLGVFPLNDGQDLRHGNHSEGQNLYGGGNVRTL